MESFLDKVVSITQCIQFIQRNTFLVGLNKKKQQSIKNEQILVKDALLQVYYLSFYGNVFGSVLLLVGTTLVCKTVFFFCVCH